MVNNRDVVKSKRPLCKCCGKPIPYRTETVYAPKEKNSGWPIQGWEYRGNHIVTVRRYSTSRETGERRLYSVHLWDGESYAPRYRFFCSVQCAALFGQRAAENKVNE